MTIDIHTHLGPDRMSARHVQRADIKEHASTLIEKMDEFGIKRAVLTPVAPYIPTEIYMEAANIHPDRLLAACSVMPRPISVAREQLESYADQGAVALVLEESMFYPEDPAVTTIVHVAVKRGLPVFFHSANISNGMLKLIDRVTETFPEGRFVLLHMGGLFGFPRTTSLIGRENLWLEISSTIIKLVESPLRVFLDAVAQDRGVRRLVFGSEHHTDYPHLLAALNMMNLNVETSRAIMYENAERILGI
ncbi:MAG: amidohydrolase family protein [Candidatus Thorarchaeota archaeon]